MGRRVTPEEEFIRFEERFFREHGKRIKDKASFEREFENYLPDASPRQNTTLKDAVFEISVARRGIEDGGKQGKLGIRLPKKTPPKRHTFNFVGKAKGRVVFARKSNFKVKGKAQTRFISKSGQFVSVVIEKKK